MEYRVIRSARRTLALEIKDGEALVRAPRLAPRAVIDAFVRGHEDWLRARLQQERERQRAAEAAGALTPEALRALKEEAKTVIPERVRYFSPLIGVTVKRVTIRSQQTKWGSCSSKGNLNFNCLLMLAPREVLDSVVVHELCHLKEMNHSERFYAEVLRVFPEYRRWHGWLRENGSVLMARLPK